LHFLLNQQDVFIFLRCKEPCLVVLSPIEKAAAVIVAMSAACWYNSGDGEVAEFKVSSLLARLIDIATYLMPADGWKQLYSV